MKTKAELAELIFEKFRATNSKEGHIIMMRIIQFSIINKLYPPEQELFEEVLNDLINDDFIIYENNAPECLRLTKKGFNHIYGISKENILNINAIKQKITNQKKSMFSGPFKILNEAIKKVPFVKYALGVAGMAATVSIIKLLSIEDYNIPIISILVVLGLMVLLYIFSNLSKGKDRHISTSGYILVYTIVIITCSSAFLLFTSVFFDFPKPIGKYYVSNKEKDGKELQDTTKKKINPVAPKDTIANTKVEEKKENEPMNLPPDLQVLLNEKDPLRLTEKTYKDGSKHVTTDAQFQYVDGKIICDITAENDDVLKTFDYRVEIILLDKKGNKIDSYTTNKMTMRSKSWEGKAVKNSQPFNFELQDKKKRIKVDKISIKTFFD